LQGSKREREEKIRERKRKEKGREGPSFLKNAIV
jgi:hypothetical protein